MRMKEIAPLLVVLLLAASGSRIFALQDPPAIGKGKIMPAREATRGSRWSADESVLDVVYREDFESSTASWSTSGGAGVVSPANGPRSGYRSSTCAVTNRSEFYPSNTETWLISPAIDLPPLPAHHARLTLEMKEWFEIESGWDHGYVEVSTDGGETWRRVSARSGKSGWRDASIDLSSYAGRIVTIGFHFISDETENFSGWYVDDLQIVLTEPQQLAATMVNLNHQNFPFVYTNISVTRDGDPDTALTQNDFTVFENSVMQTENFKVTPPEEGGGSRLTDIVFLMDNSGSMGDEIAAISENVIDFVSGLEQGGINFSLGLCRFGALQNNGYPIIEDSGQLTSDANYFRYDVWNRNVIDGGFEPGWDALYASATGFSFRPGSQKVFILITDENVTSDPNQGAYSQEQAISILQSNSVTLFALVEISDPTAVEDYCTIADATNGQCYDITTPFDQILEFIGSEVSSTYLVQYRSSDPEKNGVQRNVEVVVTSRGETATASGSYIPGSAPEIQRTAATIALHDRSWDEGTPFTIEVEVTDEAEPDVEGATLYYRTAGLSSYAAVVMSQYSGDIYRGTIPEGGVLHPGVQYYVTATDGVSTSSDPSVDPVANGYVIAVLPNEAPVITHDPVGETPSAGQAIAIEATIVDSTNQLSVARVFYRAYGDLVYSSADLNSQGGNLYQGAISGESVTDDGVEYYLYAVDDLGVGTYHGTPDAPHFIQVGSEFSAYLSLKQVVINTILGMNRPFWGTSAPFAGDAEEMAEEFVQRVETEYNDEGTDPLNLEAVARLYLAENVYRQAYQDAMAISVWGAEGLTALSFAWVCNAVFRWIRPLAEELALQFPEQGGPLVKALDRLLDKINKLIYNLILVYQNGFQMTEGPISLAQLASAREATQSGISRAFGRVTRSSASSMDNATFDTGIFDTVDYIIRDFVYLGPMDAQSEGKMESAVGYAELHYFTPDAFEEASGDVTDIMSNMISANNFMNEAGRYTETVRQTAVFVSLFSALVLIVAGVAAAVFTAGASLIASVAGVSALLLTYGSVVSQYAAITEAASVGIHIDAILPHVYMRPSVDAAFGVASRMDLDREPAGPRLVVSNLPLRVGEKVALSKRERGEAIRSLSLPVAHGGIYPKPDHSLQVFEYYQRLRDMIEAGDPAWATTGIDSLNYYESLARQDEDLTTADFMASLDSARTVIEGHVAMVNGYLGKTAAREMYSAALDISGLVYSQVSTDSTVVNTALSALDSTMVNFTVTQSVRSAVYDALEDNSIPIPTAVGIGESTQELISTDPVRSSLEFEVINFGTEEARWVQCYPLLASENARVVGDSLLIFTLAGGDTTTVEFTITSSDSFIDGTMMLQADSTTTNYYTMPGKPFTVSLQSESPPTEGTLSNENVYAFPNPFNPDIGDVTFRFRLARDGNVTIRVYDVSNSLVKTAIRNRSLSAAFEREVTWDGRNENGTVVANGVYFYVIESSSGEKAVSKVAVLR